MTSLDGKSCEALGDDKRGSMSEGSISESSTSEDSTSESSTSEGSTSKGSTNKGSTSKSSVSKGSASKGSTSNGSTREGRTQSMWSEDIYPHLLLHSNPSAVSRPSKSVSYSWHIYQGVLSSRILRQNSISVEHRHSQQHRWTCLGPWWNVGSTYG